MTDSWWPAWLEPLAWVVSVIKAIPLLALHLAALGTMAVTDGSGSGFDDFEAADSYFMLAVGGVVIVFGLPLALQVRAARRRHPVALLVCSLVLILPELSMLVFARDAPSIALGPFFAV